MEQNPEMWEVLHAVLALMLVLGLLLLTVWLIKWAQLKAAACGVWQKMASHERLRIVEQKRIDTKSKLVLCQKDDCEFLLWVGAAQCLLLEKKDNTGTAENHDEA